MKNVLKPLSKSVLVPLGLTVAPPKTASAIPKKILIRCDSINNFQQMSRRN